MEYKVLTLWEPWATLLVHGIKKIETRPKPTSWTKEKGSYLVHAAQKWGKEQADICLTEPFYSYLKELGYIHWVGEDFGYKGFSFSLHCGYIIGSIKITDCQKIVYNNYDEFFNAYAKTEKGIIITDPEELLGNYRAGCYAWFTQNPSIFKTPILYKNGQGYYQNYKGDEMELYLNIK